MGRERPPLLVHRTLQGAHDVTTALIRPGTLYAWYGPSLLVMTTQGAAGGAHPLSGFYHREARFLRNWRLEINGTEPWLCEAAAVAPDRLSFAYAFPEVTEYGGGGTGQSGDDEPRNADGIPQRALDIRVRYRVGFNTLVVSGIVANRARETVRAALDWQFDADYADIQEAQTGKEPPAGRLPYETRFRLGSGWQLHVDRIAAEWTLQAGEERAFEIIAEAITPPVVIDEDEASQRDGALTAWREGFTGVDVPGNRLFEAVFRANVRDVASFPLLEGQPDEWLALQAGMPLYPALFGRDAITAGWQAGMMDQGASLDAALTRLGRLQSSRTDDWRDEEPGRIPYQVRSGPLAILNVNPYAAYYADYASPLMFVIALANLYAWTGDEGRLAAHWDTARRILDWARERGDADGDGYLEYTTRSPAGTKNQGWKDSGDAVVYGDGTPVPAPIATCELQGYWYAAQQLFGALSYIRGARADAAAWFEAAADLKRRFNRDWWVEAESFFALAMDPRKALVAAPTSNVGHCLATGIIDDDHLPRVVGRMFAPDLFSGWGVRTLSSNHAYYNPVSYHRGSVWAVEQSTMVFGLRRYGFDARAQDLAGAQFDLARLYPEYRIPECIGGYPRSSVEAPGAYPQANTPQLWNAAGFPLIVQTLLGILPVAPFQLLIVDPALPAWLPEIELHNLRAGGARVSLRFWRDRNGASHFDVTQLHGTLRVVRQPPPESLFAGPSSRLRAAFDTLLHGSIALTGVKP